jgi:hypothetical protein
MSNPDYAGLQGHSSASFVYLNLSNTIPRPDNAEGIAKNKKPPVREDRGLLEELNSLRKPDFYRTGQTPLL